MSALKNYHPAVAFSFFLLMIVVSLASMQPVFQCIGFIAVVAYSIAISGLRAFLRGSWWILIFVAIVMSFNAFFGGRGLSVLFTLDLGFMQTQVTVEGFAYGLVMGLMLASVILWFNLLGKVSSMQGFIELFTRFSPTAGMMLARITVFIPELLAQARQVDTAQQTFLRRSTDAPYTLVATDELDKTVKLKRSGQLAYGSALSSHLMEWGMEKSLITANSMVARGYGSRKRTSFRRTRLTVRDLVPLVTILVLGILSLVCTMWGGMEYQYYPYLTPISFWWGYLPFVALCLVPLCVQLREELAWWQSS